MPTLDKNFFVGEGELEPGECAKLEIKNLTTEVKNCLSEYGWTGAAAGCISLTLSADNKKVDRGTFIVTGALGDAKEDAAKMWHGGSENVLLTDTGSDQKEKKFLFHGKCIQKEKKGALASEDVFYPLKCIENLCTGFFFVFSTSGDLYLCRYIVYLLSCVGLTICR
jgi:hypothetical protein